jgi:hypothetical protein
MTQRNIFTRRGRTARAIRDTIGALALIGGALALMLAYFDVLTK